MTVSIDRRSESGFALVMTLVFLLLLMLFLSALLSTAQQAASRTADSAEAMRIRSSVLSGIDYAETHLRQYDFTDLLKGKNGTPDASSSIARQLSFRNPISRGIVLSTDWLGLTYGAKDDDGLFYNDSGVSNPSGLLLNGCRLFFKASNNPDDPGGPFDDQDDVILVRILAATPARTPFLGLRFPRNMCEIIEVQYKRTTAFLGPAAVYCPSGQLHLDLTAGGAIKGRAEIGSGSALATGDLPPTIATVSSNQLDGDPPALDISAALRSDARLRWLANPAFVDHWKSRISLYAEIFNEQASAPRIQWAPAGFELNGGTTVRGVIFSEGPVVLRESAKIEGLLVLIDSASLHLLDTASISGAVTAVGANQVFQIHLQDQSQIEYRLSVAREALRLLPLSRTQFRYITPEMEM